MLELRHVAKTYNPGMVTEMCLFRDFNLTVPKGQFISVVGSNGSGKTSLLNIICGSIPVDAGEVCINGECVNTRKEFQRYRSIGRVYQNPALGTCGSMSILENLSLAANKVAGIRAAVCSEPYSARMARCHNNANIIAFGARVVGQDLADMIVDSFLQASFEGGRHARRVDMLMDIEKKQLSH